MKKSRGRGIDFEHRFKPSHWAEDLLIAALGEQHGLLTARFGKSEVVGADKLSYDPNARHKEPDLLVFALAELREEERQILSPPCALTCVDRKRFELGGDLRFTIEKALAAIEVEFSPYRAKEMKGRNWRAKTVEKWDKRPLTTAKPPTAPNIWVKEQDLGKLLNWERDNDVPIVVAHVFDQEAFAVPLREIENFEKECLSRPEDLLKLQHTRGLFKKMQSYDRVDAQGAGEEKPVFVVTPHAATKIGDVEDVVVTSQLSISSSKKYVTYPMFSGGRLTICPEFLTILRAIRRR